MNTHTLLRNKRHQNTKGVSHHKGSFRNNVKRGRFQNAQKRTNKGGKKIKNFDPSQFINTNPVDARVETYVVKNPFATMGLNTHLTKTIASLGMDTPTPIQDQIIPEILKGRDVVALAETGTGKTAAFLIPLIEKTLKRKTSQTLILTPTRELAIQVEAEFRKLSSGLHLYSTVCVGGMAIYPQIKSLGRQNHFIIGTPGRIKDLVKRRHIHLQKITTIVLDEADRMLDMGFITDIKGIISAIPQERETLFFSATMSSETKSLVSEFLRDPVTLSVKKKDVTNSIEQDIVYFNQPTKFETLTTLFDDRSLRRVLIFGSMKHSVERLAKQLSAHGITAESLHGNKNHRARQLALTNFKLGKVRVLVATDVAARGIHVDEVSHVINYDLPNTFEDYVHRIGRTGRATKKGKALTFIQKGA